VLAALSGNDVLLSQTTSQAKSDESSIALELSDFESGGLNLPSRVRPKRLFTADSRIVLYTTGRLSQNKVRDAVDAVIAILQAP